LASSSLRANILLLAASVGLTMFAAEAIARVVMPAPLPWRYPQLRYRYDPRLNFALRPGQSAFTADKPAIINGRGLRGPLVPYERELIRMRLLFLGDSIVFGYGVNEEERVSERVKNLLEQRGITAEVINTGVPAYNTAQEAAFLSTEGIRYDPDWVIVGMCWNDIVQKQGVKLSSEGWMGQAGGNEKSLFVRWRESPTGYAVRNALKHSRLLYGIMEMARFPTGARSKGYSRFFHDVFEGRTTPRVEESWAQFGESFNQIVALSKQHGFRLMLVAFPPAIALDSSFTHSSYPARAKALAEKEEIPFLDLKTAFQSENARNKSLYIPYDGDHPSARGHELAAKEIVKLLVKQGIGVSR
jgi:lysophospholipase L1-like esterase